MIISIFAFVIYDDSRDWKEDYTTDKIVRGVTRFCSDINPLWDFQYASMRSICTLYSICPTGEKKGFISYKDD